MSNPLWEPYEEQIKQYVAWKRYEIGFSGNGTTALDIQPGFPKPELPDFIKKELDDGAKEYAAICQNAFRRACIEVTGEDPNDWGEIPDYIG